MERNKSINSDNNLHFVATASYDVDDAVGVDRPRWYAAIVNHNAEKSSAERLTALGYDCYVATQRELRVWKNGRRSFVDRVVIGSTVFIRCTERQRRTVVCLPFIFRFITDRAASPKAFGTPVAVIPATQIERLRFMLGNSDSPVDIVDRNYGRGDKVRVVRGRLRGLEGEVLTLPDGSGELIIRLDILGCARVAIDPLDIEKLP